MTHTNSFLGTRVCAGSSTPRSQLRFSSFVIDSTLHIYILHNPTIHLFVTFVNRLQRREPYRVCSRGWGWVDDGLAPSTYTYILTVAKPSTKCPATTTERSEASCPPRIFWWRHRKQCTIKLVSSRHLSFAFEKNDFNSFFFSFLLR